MAAEVIGHVALHGFTTRVEGQGSDWRFVLATLENDEENYWIIDTDNGRGVKPVSMEGPASAVIDYLRRVNEEGEEL